MGTCQVTIHVTNGNDNNPVFDLATYDATIMEGAATGTSLITLHATDADGTPHEVSHYFLATSPYSSYFSVADSSTDGRIYALISSVKVFDRETDPSPMKVILIAQDTGGLMGSTDVLISIGDLNEFPPRMSKAFYDMEVPDDAAAGYIVGKITATDPDPGEEKTINGYL